MSEIETFARRYALDAQLLLNQETGQRPLAIEGAEGRHFDGDVEAVRIVGYGRFGNIFFSILNGLLIARALGVGIVELPDLYLGIPFRPCSVGGTLFTGHRSPVPDRPTLVGNFFIPAGLERVVGAIDGEGLSETFETYLPALYGPLLERAGSLGRHVVAMHFRGGDIFAPGHSHLGYVQPPASYYLKCFAHARLCLGAEAAHLVFEDRSNPAIDLVANRLVREGVPVTVQCASILEDVLTLVSAHHLIAPYGTFCEAAAILSPVLETFSSFRRIGTQKNLDFWMQRRLQDILRARNVRTFVVDDPDASFTAPDTWRQTADQIDLIRTYPIDKLRHLETSPVISRRPSPAG